MKRLEGTKAIAYAEANGLPLCKYADPMEEAREDLTVEEANAVAREDSRLIYIDAASDLFHEIQAAGIPYASHESDLYFKVTPQSTAILSRYDQQRKNALTFTNALDGEPWYDVPFSYTPFWEAAAAWMRK